MDNTDYVVRSFTVLADRNVAVTVVDTHGARVVVTVPRWTTTPERLDPVIRWVLAERSRPSRPSR